MDFNYFMDLENGGMTNMAILDIDGCYTNNQKFPNLYGEMLKLRALNEKKKGKISKYDYADVNQMTHEE